MMRTTLVAPGSGARPAFSSRPEKLSDKLASALVDGIYRRGLQPGDKLSSEAEMIEEYRISRGTLREALRILEMHGIIRMKSGPGGGPILRQLEVKDFARLAKLHFHMRGSTYRELFDARLAIEPLMARLAAARPDEAGLEALRKAVELGDRISFEDEDEWRAASHVFHMTVAGISGNSVLDLLGATLKEVYVGRERTNSTPQFRMRIQDVHRQIAEAIFNRDGEEAEYLMRAHMEEMSKISNAHDCGLSTRIRWP